tara:strand:- start:732 stop:2996 length:2265 start_codon:yes stop_codon:yes gene_type:complete
MSCVNHVYDTSNATFQASVTLPEYDEAGNALGGDILGGYDASLNQLFFVYENTCYPNNVTNLTSKWTSASPSYASNKNKIGLDDNCAGSSTSTPVLLYELPDTSHTDLIISQITNIVVDDKIIVVCGGNFSDSNIEPGFSGHGFIFSFDLATGAPYKVLSSAPGAMVILDGWIIIWGGGTDLDWPYVINSVYGTPNGYVIVGGTEIKLEESHGLQFFQRYEYLKIIKITGLGEGAFTFTNLPNNTAIPDFDYSWPVDSSGNYPLPTYTDVTLIEVIDIKPGMTDSSSNVIVVYQTNTYKNANDMKPENGVYPPHPVDPSGVHIRELDFTLGDVQNAWKTDDFKLPFEWGYSHLQYTSSCIGESTIYIAAGSLNYAALYVPLIYAIKSNGIAFELIPMFEPDPLQYNVKGVQVYGKNPVHWTGLQIDNISYITMKTMSGFVGVNTNTLFVTLSSVDSQYYPLKNKYISFISALTGSSQPSNGTPFNNPNSTILNALISQDSPTSTNDTIILTKNNQNLIQVQLDSKLAGTLNDLHFKLAFCSSKLHLFAFGNYVNSPSNASVSSFALLTAISWICLSKGTQILCDQGIINIEKINTRKHTINNKQINHITQSIHTDNYLIKIKKNCLSSNSPSRDIICSGDHKILYKNNLIESKHLVDEVYGVEKIKNDKRVLYNILMDKHEIIMANNTPVESLHPQNIIAMFYNNYNNPQAREFLSDKISETNNHNIRVNKINKNKLNGLMVGNKISKKMSLKM